ncbi:DUF3379 family protein [Aeromonas schubertii]|uniref:DUF3379 family protein n=1 Tax=Aeromonas TaxID=642 RepID=UPI00067ED119|nr:DUF3379 family protein [Aeromonas schubertii]KUE79997.1 hypothetical protein ATO46_16945 [Aeromonas schubertii]MBZ6074439.1 DUF3379 domain-containing protein [Aeromonas schubertii]QCG48006.1 DUF3379 domain-containing protein [Aeromonas schubertii]
MDELEFRRQALANPYESNPAFLAALQESPARRKWVEELKAGEQELVQALKVPLPEGLAERILLRQALDRSDEEAAARVVPLRAQPAPARVWRQVAVAASVAFLLGLSTRWLPLDSEHPDLSSVALAHVYGEQSFTHGVDERVSLETINAKMEKYGARLTSMAGLGHITYVNHCSFYQGPALHMEIQGSKGPITLFLVPRHVPLKIGRDDFSDGRLQGEIMELKGANMVLIGPMGEPLKPLADQLQKEMHWNI